MNEIYGATKRNPFDPTLPPPKRPFVAKGHDRQLEQLQKSEQVIEVQMSGSEDPVVGKIVRRDKYTITLAPQVGSARHLLYKSAIERISYNEEQ